MLLLQNRRRRQRQQQQQQEHLQKQYELYQELHRHELHLKQQQQDAQHHEPYQNQQLHELHQTTLVECASRQAAPSASLETFQFLLLFDRTSGTASVNYFMVDPVAPSRLIPKMNTINFKRVKDLVSYSPAVLLNCLYVIGGQDWHTGKLSREVWRFDPRVNLWNSCAPLKVARCRFTVEALDGYLYVIGGETAHRQVTDSVERYDPLRDEWTERAPLPRPRADHASCVQGGHVFLSGGISSLKHQCSSVFWAYDPIDNEWSQAVEGLELPHEREKHNMVAVGSSKIFLLAGRGFDTETFSEKDEAEVCHFNVDGCHGDLSDRKPYWDLLHQPMLHPHSNGAAVLLGRNVWVIGGLSYTKGSSVRTVCYYDVKRRKWKDVFTLPEGSFTNVECVVLSVPASNRDFCSFDRFLFHKWIMW